jgi:hypothetical protein
MASAEFQCGARGENGAKPATEQDSPRELDRHSNSANFESFLLLCESQSAEKLLTRSAFAV